jgi:DNA-binding transcriptional regulator PaaX
MKDKPHWMELCQQAAVEQDSQKLLELVKEINRLLDEKQDRLGRISDDTKK